LLLLLLATQAVLAQYEPSGSLTLSSDTVQAGGQVGVSGTGFGPNTTVQLTIQSDPVHLATVTTTTGGTFSANVTVPTSFSGTHTIVAAGVDASASVRVLAAQIQVLAGLPATDTSPNTEFRQPSDSVVLAVAGAGIVMLTAGLLFLSRRRSKVG
jgi:LPXTG-motif cell wall-anchored protein